MSTSELFDTFEANPKDVRAFDALVRALLDAGDRDGLEAIYDHLPEWVEDASSSPLMRVLMQKARACEDRAVADWLHYRNGLSLWRQFQENQRAESCFRKIEAQPPDPGLIREFYMGFYTAQKNWRRLEQFLTDPERGPGEEPLQVKRTLGRLADEHGQPERALTFWQSVYEADVMDRDANEALSRLYPKVGKWHSMVDLLKERLHRVDPEDDTARFALFDEIIRIYKDELRAPSKVIAAWQAVLEFSPGNRRALDALLLEYEEMNRWPDAVRVLKLTIEATDDTAEKIVLHRRIATLMLDTFSNAAEAIVHLEAILSLDPSDMRANAALRETYETRRDWYRFATAREREIAQLDDPGVRHAALIDLATLTTERVRQLDVPVRLWRQVLETEGDHPEALAALEDLYERSKSWEELSAILERRASATKEPDPSLSERLALLYGTKLNDHDEAERWWRALLSATPDHRKAQSEVKRRLLEREDWDALESLHRDAGTLEAWGRTLEGQAKASERPEEEVQLLRRATHLWRTEIVDLRRAMRCCDRMLELVPDDLGVLTEAIEVYRGADAPKKLATGLEALALLAEDADQRRDALRQLSRTRATELHDPEGAYVALATLIDELPGDITLLEELETLAANCGRYGGWAEIVENLLPEMTETEDRLRLLHRLGEAYGGPLSNPGRAIHVYERILEERPDHEDTLHTLEQLHRGEADWTGLVQTLEQRISIAEEAQARRALRLELAEVLRSHLDRPADAADILEMILAEASPESDDDLREVHDALVEIHLATGDAEALAGALAGRLELHSASAGSPILLADHETALGMLAYATREDRWRLKAAVDHYEKALSHVPGHATASTRLEELLASEDYRRRVAEILERDALARDVKLRVAETLEVQVVCALDVDAVSDALELLDRLARLYRDELRRWDEAWSTLMRMVSLDPSREGAITDLEALTDELGRWRHVATLYEDLAEGASGTPTQARWLAACARTWHYRLGEMDTARRHYEAMAELPETEDEALEALEEIFRSLDRPDALLEVLERRLDKTEDPGLQSERLMEVADLLQDRLRRYPEAIGHLLIARDLEPASELVHERLVSLLGLTESWETLSETLAGYIEQVRAEPGRLVVARDRLARVREQRLGDLGGAIELYGELLGEDDEHPGALAAVERLFEDPAVGHRVASILEPIYLRRGAWKKLIRVLEAQAQAEESPLAQIPWHERIGSLYEEKAENVRLAFEHRATVFALDPGRVSSLEELERLATKLNNHEELMLLLMAHVESTDLLDRKIALHRTIAGLAREKVGDLSLAERHLEAVLSLTEHDDGALDELISVSRHTRDERRLVELLVAKADMAADPAEVRALLSEAGEISGRDDETLERAIEVTERLYELDPSAAEPLDDLDRLYGRLGSWEALADVLTKKLERATERSSRGALGARLGELQSEKLGATLEAVDTWRGVLEGAPGDRAALRALDELYLRLEDWSHLKEILVLLQSEVDELGWVDLQVRIAELDRREDCLDRPHEAIAGFAAVLDRRPDHDKARDALRAMIEEGHEPEAAFGVLEPVLAGSNDLEMIWHLHQVMAAHHQEDRAVQYETYREMARLALDDMGAPARAFEAWSLAFHAGPDRVEAREALTRLAEALGRWEELVALLIEHSYDSDDLELERVMLIEAGGILETELRDLEAAEAIYGRVIESHPDDLHALERLGSLYRGSGDLQAWMDTLARRCSAESDLERRTALLLRHAQAARDDLVDLDLATASYLEVMDTAGPRDEAVESLWAIVSGGHRVAEITQRLRPVFENRQSWDRLHAVMEMQLDILESPESRLTLMDRLAEMNLEELDREEEALVWLGRAAQQAPGDGERVEAAIRLGSELKLWDELHTILMGTAVAAPTDELRIDLWLRASELALEHGENPEEGERTLRLVLELNANHELALSRLDDLMSTSGRWQELEPVLLRQLDSVAYDEERCEVLMRLGVLYRDHLGQSDGARLTFERLLEIQENHRPALRALETLLRDTRDFEALFEVLERLAEIATDRGERARLLTELGGLAERELRDESRAMELWQESLDLEPNQPRALRDLQRLAESHGDWERVLGALQQEVRLGLGDGERLLDLHKRCAYIIRDELGDPFRAQTHWQAAREVAPRDRETLDALAEVHRDSANLEALALTLEAQHSSGKYLQDETAEIWHELAVLYTSKLVDPARAIDAWREVLHASPSDEHALSQLERLFESEGRWADAVHHFTDRMEAMEGSAKLTTWLRIAEIQRDHLQDTSAAMTTYSELLRVHPEHEGASRALESLLRADGLHDALAVLLLDRVEHLEAPEARHQGLRELASVYLDLLDQPTSAFLALQKAASEQPRDLGTRAELERLAAVAKLWGDLVETYDSVLEHLSGVEARDLTVRAAELVEKQLHRPQVAAGYYSRALAIDPDHDSSLRAMARLCSTLGRWADLVDLLDRLAERATDYREQLEWLHRLAEIQEQELGDVPGAIASWYRVLDNDPLYRQGIENLERLHSRSEQWEALIEVLERRTQIEPGEAVNIALRIGDVLRNELDRADDAVERFEDVLSYEPGHEGALQRLAEIHGDQGRWIELVAIYIRAFGATHEIAKRIELARTIAQLQQETFADRDASMGWYRRVLELDPGDLDALDHLERLYRESEAWPELLRVLESIHTHAPEEPERIGALLRRARILRDQLGDAERACESYEAVLTLHPERDEALQALEELYSQATQWGAVLGVLQRKAAISTDEETQVELLRRQGRIADEKMHDVDRSAKYYERALQWYPGHSGVLRSLVEIYERSGRYQEAVQVLEDSLESAPTTERKSEVHLQVATIWRDRLGNEDKNLLHLEAAAEANPRNPEALWLLSSLYIDQGQWERALVHLEVLAEVMEREPDKTKRAEVHRRIARCAEGLSDPQRALEEYRVAAELVPEDHRTLYGLGIQSFKAGLFEEARRTLKALLSHSERRLDRETKLQIHLRLGECATKVGDLQEATQFLERVVESDPENPAAIGAVVDVLERATEWAEAIGYLERMLPLQRDAGERSLTLQRIGALHRDKLDDPLAAIGSLEGAIAEGTLTRAPLSALVELHQEAGNFERALECIDGLLASEDDPTGRANFAMIGAALCRDDLRVPRRAVQYFDEALDALPGTPQAFESLVDVLAGLQDWEGQSAAFLRMITRVERDSGDEERLFGLHRDLGELHQARRLDPQAAIEHFEQAAVLRPHELAVRESLANLYEQTDEHLERAADTHQALLSLDPSRLDSYHRLFGLWGRLEEPERAWCVAGLLVGMGEANADEQAAYDQARSSSIGALSTLPTESWDHGDADLDTHLSRVFGLLYENLGNDLGAMRPEDLGIRRKDRLDPSTRTLVLSMIERVAAVLGLAVPEVYMDRQREGLRVLPLMPPALGISPSMMSGQAPRELVFHAARALYALHPKRALAAIYEPQRLELLLMAALEEVCDPPSAALQPDLPAQEVRRVEAHMRSVGGALGRALTSETRQELKVLLTPYASGEATPDVEGWVARQALARNHAALACCGDVALAMSLVRDDESGQLPLGRGDQLKHLVSFAVSEEHQSLRAGVHGALHPGGRPSAA